MDKITATLAGLAIMCATIITMASLYQLTGDNIAAKEVAILAITAMFSAISGGGIGYVAGKKGGSDETEE